MDLPDFCRALSSLRRELDSPEFYLGDDVVEEANPELTNPDPSAAVFEAAAAALEAQALGLGFYHRDNLVEGANTAHPSAAQPQSPLGLCLGDGDGDFYLTTITDEKEALEKLDREFHSQNDIAAYFSDSDQHRGIEHAADDGNQANNNFEEAMATHEHGSNNLTESRVSGVHCRNHRAGDAHATASSQRLNQCGSILKEDERRQVKREINHKSSQGASSTTLPETIGDQDETQSTANIDGEELVSDAKVPRVGMEFCSEEEVYDFYNNYAKQTGFNLRRGKAEYLGSNKAIIKAKHFLCSCQGHKSKEQIHKPTRYKRRDTRTGCEAKIKCVVSDGMWMISKVVLEHNHALGCLAVAHGRVEDSSAMTALSTENIVNEVRTVGKQALVSNVDCSDILQGTWKNHPMPEPKDTQDLIDHFKNRQIKDPSFFCTSQITATPGMANFFWRDSRSKIDYEHFGDVLVLDTRTEINKYDMICAAFWGLNHHQERIIFGCAFLIDRTVASLKWLLQSFLEAMSRQKPRTIITEVSEEIADALRVHLPETSHCLPFWSILNGFTKNVPPLTDQPGVSDLLSECFFHVDSQEEFELKWNSFIEKYRLHENSWLASLNEMRQKWSHAFTKNVFSAGLISIQNNEDARAIFGNLFCETMTLSQIAHRCGEVAECMREEEYVEDMRCEKFTANLQSRSPMEKEAERLYTRPIFRMFQKELINSLSLAIEEIGSTAAFGEFKLTEEGSTKIDTVKFDPSNSTLVCSCGKFESVGILCFHTLKALNFMNIFKIPSRYILKRWTKSAKETLPVDTPSASTAHDGGPVNLFMGEFMRWALHVAHMSVNKKRKGMAMGIMKLASEHIAKIPKAEEVAVPLDNSEGNEDMDQTICKYALETQLEQESAAKSGMGFPRMKRKVLRPSTNRKTKDRIRLTIDQRIDPIRSKTSFSERITKHAD